MAVNNENNCSHILPQEDNSVEENRSYKFEAIENENGDVGKNISVPFFGGNLSLAQVQEMQRKARKKCKLSTKIEQSIENNRVASHLNRSQPTYSTPKSSEFRGNSSSCSVKSLERFEEGGKTKLESGEFRVNSPSYSEKILEKFEEVRKEKLDRKTDDKFSEMCHNARDIKTSSTIEKTVDVSGKKKTRVESRDNEPRLKKESNSYLEQYRKRVGVGDRAVSPGSKSISSSKSQFSLDMSSTFHTDMERLSEVGSSCLCCSSSEEKLYREIIDSDVKAHSSAKSSFVSCESSLELNDALPSGASKKHDECGSKENNVVAKERTKTSIKSEKEHSRPTKSPQVPLRLARSLGPDLEAIKPKLSALQKRKEYGNKMSCLNRETNPQKSSADSNKKRNSSTNNDEEGVEIPIITYIIDQYDPSQLLKKPTSKVQKRKKLINTIKKTADDVEDAGEVKLMIQRHEEEKRLAENIKHQLLLK